MSNIQTQFLKFHARNPHIYDLFCAYANQLILAGNLRASGTAILERIRWDSMVSTTGDRYKVSQRWAMFYTRMFMLQHPKHSNFFATRRTNFDN